MRKVTQSQAAQLKSLEQQLGDKTLRTLLGPETRGIMRPQRLGNLTAGTGKLSEEESRLVNRITQNRNAIERLKEKRTGDERQGLKRKDWKVNRSIRDWVKHGKERGVDRKPGTDEQRAIRGLRFLGVDPSEQHYYLRKRKG